MKNKERWEELKSWLTQSREYCEVLIDEQNRNDPSWDEIVRLTSKFETINMVKTTV